MNYIENWFHFYNTTESFEVHRKQGLINPDSICFLRETAQIYTQGHLFGICKERFEKLEELILEHETKLKDILGVEGQSVDDGIINNMADIVDFLSGFTDEDNLKEFIEAIKKSLSDKIDTLEEDINSELEELRNLINAVDGKISAINTKLDNHDTEIAALNTALEAHIREFKLLKSSYESFKTYAESKFSSVDSSILALNTSVQSLQSYFEELDEKFDDVENEVSRVEALLEDAKNLVQGIEDKFGETLAAIEQFKRDINEEIDDFKSLVGAPDGIAPLDGEAKVPSEYLPSYVDDVLEYATKTAFPTEGEKGKIYVALDDNLTYRWSGSIYVEISKSLGLGENATTAYPGNKGKKNADDIAAHIADTDNPHKVTKAQLGLDNVNNTADLEKPISNPTQAALDVITNSLESHITDYKNPHKVTKEQVGLDKVDNTSDKEKPISDAAQNLFDTKVDKVVGKGLSTNDFTNEDKAKLDNSMSNRNLSSDEIDSLESKNAGDLVYNTTTNKYVFWNGSSWEEVGYGDVSNYVTNDSLSSQLGSYATKEELDAYATDNELTTALQGYVTKDALENYVTEDTLNSYVTNESLTSKLDDYVTNTVYQAKVGEIETSIGTKVDKVEGKDLSSNDFTNEYKGILDDPWGETIQ